MVRGEILDRERGLPHPGEVSPVPPRGGINPRRFLFVLQPFTMQTVSLQTSSGGYSSLQTVVCFAGGVGYADCKRLDGLRQV